MIACCCLRDNRVACNAGRGGPPAAVAWFASRACLSRCTCATSAPKSSISSAARTMVSMSRAACRRAGRVFAVSKMVAADCTTGPSPCARRILCWRAWARSAARSRAAWKAGLSMHRVSVLSETPRALAAGGGSRCSIRATTARSSKRSDRELRFLIFPLPGAAPDGAPSSLLCRTGRNHACGDALDRAAVQPGRRGPGG